MTSQASLAKPRKARRYNPWLHSFWQTARESAVVAALSTLVYLCMFGGSFLNMLTDAAQQNMKAGDIALYYLFSPQLAMFLPVILLIASLIQGVLSFRFLFNKGTTNAWFSLGMTRSHLFSSRFLAGAAAMVLPIVAAMAVLLVMNLSVFHRDVGMLLTRWGQMMAGLCVQAFALFAIAAAVCSVAGTVVEGLGYTFIAACLPCAVLMSMNTLMLKFLPGFGIGAPEYDWAAFNPQLVTDLAGVNPLIFLYRFAMRYATDNGQITEQVSALPMLGWLAAGVLIAWLAHRLFRSRRLEVTGVLGGNQPLGFAAIFVVAMFAFSAPYMLDRTVSQLPITLLLAVSGLLAAIIFCVMAFPLKLVGRPAWKSLLALPAGLLVLFSIVGLFSSGCLGYSSYVPDSADVKSVEISYNGVPAYARKTGGWSGGSGVVMTMQFNSTVELTDPADISTVTGLHKACAAKGGLDVNLDAANPADMVYSFKTSITYKMKDGRSVTRLFQRADHDLMMKMLAIDGLAGTKKAFTAYLTVPNESRPHDNDSYLNGSVYLTSRFLEKAVPVDLSDADRQELLGCLAQDVANQSADDRYFPAKPEVCVLIFTNDSSLSPDGFPDWGDRIYVTESFTNTIGFLNRNNLLQSVSADPGIDYLAVEYIFNNADVMLGLEQSHNLPLLMGGRSVADDTDDKNGSLRVTDPAQIASILEDCRSQYLSIDGGYLVYVHFKGDKLTTTVFLPAKDAPEFIKKP